MSDPLVIPRRTPLLRGRVNWHREWQRTRCPDCNRRTMWGERCTTCERAHQARTIRVAAAGEGA